MKYLIQRLITATLLVFPPLALADLSEVPSGTYKLDPAHGYITVSYSHLGFSNPHLGFDNFDVELELDSADPSNSKLHVSIDATSVNSRVEVFNGHLNSPNFFDTANHPEITFVASEIRATGENTFDVVGTLTIKGISNPVTLNATVNKAALHPMRKVPTVGISAEATISRSAWELSRAVPAVGDEVTISIDVELPQQTD